MDADEDRAKTRFFYRETREIREKRQRQILTEEWGNPLRQGGRCRAAQISAQSPEPKT